MIKWWQSLLRDNNNNNQLYYQNKKLIIALQYINTQEKVTFSKKVIELSKTKYCLK